MILEILREQASEAGGERNLHITLMKILFFIHSVSNKVKIHETIRE